MGEAKKPNPAKLVVGILASSEKLLGVARERIQSEVGSIQQASPVWPFDNTEYYRDEIGETILRQFVSMEGLFEIERLPDIKHLTNDFELAFAGDYATPTASRPINLDPGYLVLPKFVLATTKDFAHRLYLRDGMYAEVTLRFHSGGWHAWPWTYHDYACGTYFPFFNEVRDILKDELKKL